MSILLLVVFTTLAVSAICSLMEATLYNTRIATLEAAKTHNRYVSSANSMLAMKKDVARPTSAILILNTIANTAGATIAGMLAAREFGRIGVPIFSAILTVAILFVSEILPKTIGAVHWRIIWPFVVPPLNGIQKLLTPVIWITQWFFTAFVKGKAPPVTTEAEILALIRLGAGVGELTPTELELLTNVFQFDEVITRQVMIPRREVIGLEVSWNLDQCIDIIGQTTHTRYPLYSGSLDTIVGLVHVKDLVKLRSKNLFDLRQIARELVSVSEKTPLRSLLKQAGIPSPYGCSL